MCHSRIYAQRVLQRVKNTQHSVCIQHIVVYLQINILINIRVFQKKNPRITWFPRQLFRDGELHKKKRQNNVGATTRLGVSREFKTTHDAEKKYNQRSVADHSVQQFKDVSNKSGIYNNTTVSYFIFYQYLFISFCVYLYCYILYLEISNLCRVILVVVTIAILTLMN